MKNLTLVLALSLPMVLFAQAPTDIKSKINNVTVFPRGAQVERTASKFISAGRQTLTFSGLASELDPSSISVSASNGVNVLGVTTQTNFLKESDKPKEVVRLQDSLSRYEFDLQFNQNMLGVYQQERNMILANQKVGWEKTAFVIEDLEDLSDFYRDRLADIMLKEMELQSKQKNLNENIARLRRQLNEFNSKLNRATGEVVVEILATGNVNASFTLSYMVRNAGWVPSYSITVTDVNQPLQVSYNAKVFQNSGIDWKDVTLILTNANPLLGSDKPVLDPWRLNFVAGVVQYEGYSMSNKALPMAMGERKMNMVTSDQATSVSSVDYAMNKAATRFEIKTRYDIPSNNKPQVIGVDVFTLNAEYEYYAAPKIDPTAFLVARVAGFEKYDLLPGQANLFFSNTYVGQAFIDPNIFGDTLDLSLGRDQSIVVKREKVKELCETKKIGNSLKETIGVQISVKNTKGGPITLTIVDQIPVSTNKDISVELDENATGVLSETTGQLKWVEKIGAGEGRQNSFRYTVKYPADRKINF
jgi:uncharacterized protein (TIGR02231 family)